jgi:hypothetical protein
MPYLSNGLGSNPSVDSLYRALARIGIGGLFVVGLLVLLRPSRA